MIKWLTEEIGTGAYNEVVKLSNGNDFSIIDVRELVDKTGNTNEYILAKINTALDKLADNKKVIICCDYGMSRSNSIAIGVISKRLNIGLSESVTLALKKIDESDIKLEMLNTVYDALKVNGRKTVKIVSKNIFITGGKSYLSSYLGKALATTNTELFAPDADELDLANSCIGFDLYVKLNGIKTIVYWYKPGQLKSVKAFGESIAILKNVLEVCRLNEIRMLYVSSWEVFSGYVNEPVLMNDKTLPKPKGLHGEAKWIGELLVDRYVANYGLKATIIRPTYVYGDNAGSPNFIETFKQKALNNEDIVIHEYKNGLAELDVLHIDDMVNALVLILNSNFVGQVNIGSGKGVLVKKIAETICDLTKSSSSVKSIAVDENAPKIISDNTVAEKVLNWTSEIDLRTGLKKIINGY